MHNMNTKSVKAVNGIIEGWIWKYNEVRPYSSLGNRTPVEFSTEHTAMLREQILALDVD